MIASVDARIEMAERALNGMVMKETPAYRIKNIKQSIERLKTDKKEFRSSLAAWQLRLKAAQRRAEGLYPGDINLASVVTGSELPREMARSIVRGLSLRRRPQRIQHSRTIAQKSPKQAVKSPLNYRSHLKRSIMAQLIRDPESSDLQICRNIDADGGIDLPTKWSVGKNRLCVIAYRNSDVRPRIHTAISKVRADLLRHRIIR
jgi:hypothetical protein